MTLQNKKALHFTQLKKIFQTTTKALHAKKANGAKLGRPNGRGKSKLDEHQEEILKLVDLKVPKTIIARQYNTSVANLHRFLKNK